MQTTLERNLIPVFEKYRSRFTFECEEQKISTRKVDELLRHSADDCMGYILQAYTPERDDDSAKMLEVGELLLVLQERCVGPLWRDQFVYFFLCLCIETENNYEKVWLLSPKSQGTRHLIQRTTEINDTCIIIQCIVIFDKPVCI